LAFNFPAKNSKRTDPSAGSAAHRAGSQLNDEYGHPDRGNNDDQKANQESLSHCASSLGAGASGGGLEEKPDWRQ
jgi:hypothetical protein